jgi:hypothetical protein
VCYFFFARAALSHFADCPRQDPDVLCGLLGPPVLIGSAGRASLELKADDFVVTHTYASHGSLRKDIR